MRYQNELFKIDNYDDIPFKAFCGKVNESKFNQNSCHMDMK